MVIWRRQMIGRDVMQDSGLMPKLVPPSVQCVIRLGWYAFGICELGWKTIIKRRETNGGRQQPATVVGQEGPHSTVR